jgi:hypothetical protein
MSGTVLLLAVLLGVGRYLLPLHVEVQVVQARHGHAFPRGEFRSVTTFPGSDCFVGDGRENHPAHPGANDPPAVELKEDPPEECAVFRGVFITLWSGQEVFQLIGFLCATVRSVALDRLADVDLLGGVAYLLPELEATFGELFDRFVDSPR